MFLVTGPGLGQHSGFAWTWPLDREPHYLETSFPACSPPAMFAMELSNDAPRLSREGASLLPWSTIF
jgi:hypothetical protein